jgi:hypothetical protein
LEARRGSTPPSGERFRYWLLIRCTEIRRHRWRGVRRARDDRPGDHDSDLTALQEPKKSPVNGDGWIQGRHLNAWPRQVAAACAPSLGGGNLSCLELQEIFRASNRRSAPPPLKCGFLGSQITMAIRYSKLARVETCHSACSCPHPWVAPVCTCGRAQNRARAHEG